MAYKIVVLDSVFTITDTVSGLIVYSLPSPDVWYKVASLQSDEVVILDRKFSVEVIGWRAPLADCIDSSDESFTVDTFIEFMHKSVGYATYAFSTSTGFASYTDTEYSSGSPLSVSSGVPTLVPNNAGVVYDDQIPPDIETFWDASEQLITGRNGDNLDIMLYWKVTPTSINSQMDIWIDIGGSVGELYRQTFYFRNTDTKGVLYALPSAYTRDTWELYGGKVWMLTNSDMNMYGFTFNFDRSHKAR